jgi:hypothetical protein
LRARYQSTERIILDRKNHFTIVPIARKRQAFFSSMPYGAPLESFASPSRMAQARSRVRAWSTGFSGRIVAEFSPAIVLHDPVVEAAVRHDVNGRDRHEFLFRSALKNERNVASPAVVKIVACQPLATLLYHQRVSKISVDKRNRR